MNELIRQALKEALSEVVADIIVDIEAGKFDIINSDCSCGRSEHPVDAKYCGNCGKQLGEAAGTTSPM